MWEHNEPVIFGGRSRCDAGSLDTSLCCMPPPALSHARAAHLPRPWRHHADIICHGPSLTLPPADPFTKRWSQKGSLASMVRPRLYHSSAVLLPNCQVMVGGSDVTNDTTAE